MSEQKYAAGACIKVIGVGGGGGNMINHMASGGIGQVELIAANTDAQALEASMATTIIQLGERKTKGLGAGMKPEVGKNAAIDSYDDIKEALEGADIVFIASGLGGGTGTGATPVVAQAAKEIGALSVSIVTKPFAFEGRKRTKLAEAGLGELKKDSDSIVVIPNDKLLSIVDKKLGIKDSFKLVDDILSRAVGGMSSVVLSYGPNDINVDFADVETVMGHKGMAILGVGEAVGENAAIEAIRDAIESPLLDNLAINGAMGVLVHFHIHENFPLAQIQDAMEIIYDHADEDADVIFGTTTNESFAENEVKITLVITGFDNKDKEQEEESLSEDGKISPINETKKPKTQIDISSIKRRISNGNYDIDSNDLDYPTFLRNRIDD